MDMKLNRKTIKKLRLARAWSQSQLAELTDLSLRTIQRIEKQGQASLESAKSLAAVFEKPLQTLEDNSKAAVKLWAVPLVMTGLLGLLFILPASADSIMLNVLLKEKNQVLADVQLLNKANQESELKLGTDMKLTFSTHVTSDDMIHIAVKIYERLEGGMKLVAEPAIKTQHQLPAEIKLDGLSITLEPNL